MRDLPLRSLFRLLLRRSVGTSICVACVLWLAIGGVRAQELSPAPNSSTAPTITTEEWALSPIPDDDAGLLATYRAQLEQYRSDERSFQLARAEYHKLQTLASLEHAVQAWRAAAITRNDVLMTYAQRLGAALRRQQAVEPQELSQAQEKLLDQQRVLQDFRKQLDAADSRDALRTASAQFAPITVVYKREIGDALGLLYQARAAAVVSDGHQFSQGLAEQFAQIHDPIKKAEKLRGLDEVNRVLDDANVIVRSIIAQRAQQSDDEKADQLRGASQSYQGLFTMMRRVETFLTELVTKNE